MVIALSILHLISCLALVCIVVLQSGKKSGLTAISGGSESYLAKNRNASLDARLARWTKWAAIVFAVLTLVMTLVV